MTDTCHMVDVCRGFFFMAIIYIHIPYCKSKCLYCDFFSGGIRQARWDDLVNSLLSEMRNRIGELEEDIHTLYIGGGTPSLMPIESLRRLIDGVKETTQNRWDIREATIEANPDDIQPDIVEQWKQLGLTRLSIGVQSLDDDELKIVGRRHDSASARRSINIAMHSGLDVSIDLIFGLPGQTPESWKRSVDEIIAIRPHHISAYSLMLEPGTPLTILCREKRLEIPDDDTYNAMFAYLTESLTKAGYQQYEISNYSLPGHHSRHNSSYWEGIPYIGIGPSAHSYDGKRTRRANKADLHHYLENPGAPLYSIEHLDDDMLLDEYLLTRLRTQKGINIKDFTSRFGNAKLLRLEKTVSNSLIASKIMNDGITLSLKREGILTADDIISEIAARL